MSLPGFSATLWKYTTREVRRRPGRTALTLAGIIIGVATVVAITATTRATRRSYQNMFDEIGGKASLEIVTPGQGGFDAAPIQEALKRARTVSSCVGLIQTRAGLIVNGVVTPVLVLGIDPDKDSAARTWDVVEGQMLGDGDAALLEANFARANGFALGGEVFLGAETGAGKLSVVGLLRASGPALYNGGAVVVVPLPTAQRLFRMAGKVNSLQIVLAPGVSLEQGRADIESALPAALRDTVQIQTPAARVALAQSTMMTTEQALSALSAVSLVGGGFVILNSFLMNLGERRRQLAILRALGTTRRQVTGLLLREAVLLGGTGTLLGAGVGVVLARGLVHMQEQMLGVKLPPLDFGAEPFVLALLFGPGLSLLATVIPAWQAGKRSPLEAMRPRRSTPELGQQSHWPRWLGLVLLVTSSTAMLLGMRGWWPPEVGTVLLAPGMMLILVGCVLVLPAILTPLLALTRFLLRPIFGAEGAIALRQLERQHTRTALTSGVLFIGVIVTIGFGSSLLNNIHDIDVWFRGTIPADFLVRGSMPDGGTIWASPLPRELHAEMQNLAGVDRANLGRITFVPVQVGGRSAILLARDYPSGKALSLSLVDSQEDDVRAGLERGEVVLGTPLAHRTGVGVGDAIVIRTKQGDRSFRVAGLVKEYTVGGMALYMNWDAADRFFTLPGINAFEVYALPDQRARAESALKEFAASKRLLMQSNLQVRAVVDGLVSSVEGFLWVLIALVFVVAALGIVNTLTMNVIEQTRELGVLRAIGLKRSQVRKLVIAQAAALGLLSVVPGILAGLLMSWLMNESTYPFSGHRVAFTWRPGFVLGCAVAALVIAVLAALLPARRAARLRIIEALHYE